MEPEPCGARRSRKYLAAGTIPRGTRPYNAPMAVLIDNVARRRRPAPPSGKGASAGPAGLAQARLDSRQGAGLAGLSRDAADRARERPAHGLRGGRLPQYRRVLGEKARHFHDHGRHLHAGLRLLQRQDRAARRARCRRAGARRRGDAQSSGLRMSSSPRSIATISTTAGQRISPPSSAPSARAARTPRSKC